MGAPPLRARCDFGGEFTGKCTHSFPEICAERGIYSERSLPYDSPTNGVAERANRSVLEAARTMMLAAGLPKECWGYAWQIWFIPLLGDRSLFRQPTVGVLSLKARMRWIPACFQVLPK